MWTGTFWKAAAERAVRAAAAGVLGTWIIADGAMNALEVNWEDTGGIALGSALVSLVLSLAGNAATSSGPSFNQTETVAPKPN